MREPWDGFSGYGPHMEKRRLALGLTLALSSVSCASHQSGRFAQDAYYEELFPVRGLYADTAKRQVIPGEWMLLNYQFKRGLPDKPKVTGDTHYKFDTDGDGSLDTNQTVKTLSLEYEHARTGAEAWFFMEPLSVEDARLDLKVLADNHVEASSGAGTVIASIAPGVAVSTTRKLATRVLDGKTTTIDGLPAYVITYEIANVDQLSLSQTSRWRRARLTLIRTPYLWTVRHAGRVFQNWPVIAVVGYQAEPGAFDEHLPEYAGLVANLDFMDDEEVIRAKSADLSKCSEGGVPMDVLVDLIGDGTTKNPRLGNVSSNCVRRALSGVRFAPTGVVRTASAHVLPGPAPLPAVVVPPEVLAPVPSPAVVPTPSPEPAATPAPAATETATPTREGTVPAASSPTGT
jgi:hypothetical protein